jgi:hypothetical protein
MIPVRRYAALQAKDPLAPMALDDTQHVTELVDNVSKNRLKSILFYKVIMEFLYQSSVTRI